MKCEAAQAFGITPGECSRPPTHRVTWTVTGLPCAAKICEPCAEIFNHRQECAITPLETPVGAAAQNHT